MSRNPPHTSNGADAIDVERIVCASTVRQPDSLYSEMERIRHDSVRHNQRHHIHAALLCQSGWYVHWVEGPGPAVRELVQRVGRDPRHSGQRMLHHSWGKRYLLTRWSMMLHPSTEPADVLGRRVEDLRKRYEAGHQFPPTSVVRRISAPLRLLASDSAADPEAFHRVGVCSADEGRSFELVRWLADHHGRRTHARRMSGESDLDSGTDYVEFMADGYPCRVIAVSRAGLSHGMRRAFLPDWPHLVMLFGHEAARNTALMERVRNACMALPSTPELLGVAADPSVHERMATMAVAVGLRYRQLGVLAPEQHDDVWHLVRDRLKQAGPPPSSQWDLTHPGWTPA